MAKPLLTIEEITRTALDVLERELSTAWKPVYFKVRKIGGAWYIAEGAPSGPCVKDGLTEEEADVWLRLLQ